MLQLLGASAVAAGGAAVATVGSFAVLGHRVRHPHLVPAARAREPVAAAAAPAAGRDAGHVPPLADGRQPRRAGRRGDRRATRCSPAWRPTTTTSASSPTRPRSSRTRRAATTSTTSSTPRSPPRCSRATSATGIDIAYKSGLPKALIAFIPQHHGTAVMSYFYARAREQAAEPYGGLADRGRPEGGRRRRHPQVPPRRPEAADARGGDHHARRLCRGIRAVPGVPRRGGDPGHGLPDLRGADRRRPVRRVRPDPARHRADPRGVRGAAAGHVPPADRVPAEQGRRVESRRVSGE